MKITFVGPVSPPPTGPGITNKNIIDILQESKYDLKVFNTLEKGKLFFSTIIIYIIWANVVVISVSEKGRYILIPILYVLSLIKVSKFVVRLPGGKLDKEIEALPKVLKEVFKVMLSSSHKICTETACLERKLEDMGFDNVSHIGNTRKDRKHRWIYSKEVMRVVFLSKVRPRKGVPKILEAFNILSDRGNENLRLHIYGPVLEKYQKQFRKMISRNDLTTYEGLVNYENVQSKLAEYDLFIFPTQYDGEGYPGALIEASIVGMPIITSNFDAASEMIVDRISGRIIDNVSPQIISSEIENLSENLNAQKMYSRNVKQRSKKYTKKQFANRLLECIPH